MFNFFNFENKNVIDYYIPQKEVYGTSFSYY